MHDGDARRPSPDDRPGGPATGAAAAEGRRWFAAAARAVARHPSLWPTAARQALRLAAPGWWRRRPFLPLPDPAYLRFRLQTAYGGAGEGPPAAEDLVTWLRWCRALRRLPAGG
ncbi:MAG: hypothetical protein FWJ94_01480 [Acidimicrobiia bacterium]|jgi:hypothetical protein|nr:hypothetical protein [Thermoanaerobacterales bacterium]